VLGYHGISRLDQLKHFRTFLKRYSKTSAAEWAGEIAATLEKMVAEEKARRHKRAIFVGPPSKDELIAGLLQDLREELDWGPLYSDNPSGDPRSPLPMVLNFGYEAIPQLIKALDDKSYTRRLGSEGFCRTGMPREFPSIPFAMGQLARVMLEHIAARSFNTRSDFESWWQQAQKKGEKQMLIEGTAVGDFDSVSQARRLVKKYPKAALQPIFVALRHPKFQYIWIPGELVRIASQLPKEDVIGFLRVQLKSPHRSARARAAEGLLAHGRADGLNLMIRKFESRLQKMEDDDLTDVIDFLAWCDRPEAIDALGRDLTKRPLRVRSHIVYSLGNPAFSGREARILSAPVTDAIGELLVKELDDRDLNDIGTSRICDDSAQALLKLLGGSATFNGLAPVEVRDRQINELKRLWKEKKNRHRTPE